MSSDDRENVAAFQSKADIKEEAGAWLVRLDTRKLNEAEVQALREWVRRSDFHRNYLLKLASNWDAMGALRELADFFPLPDTEPHHEQPPAATVRLWKKLKSGIRLPVVAMASVASLLIAVVVLTLGTLFGPGQPASYTTAVGERASHTLADGTTVALNTDSHLRIDYTETRRAVTLERGEASFSVAKNPERPFVVYAGTGMVWAVGTAFNVRYTPEGVDVTVTEGTVKVVSDLSEAATEPPADPHIPTPPHPPANSPEPAVATREALLNAGQAIRFSQVIQIMQPVVGEDLKRKLAWQQGALIFKGETLEEAIREIGRYTDKELVITDPAITALRIGGHYKTDDIDSLLATLAQSLDIQVRPGAGNRILLSARADL